MKVGWLAGAGEVAAATAVADVVEEKVDDGAAASCCEVAAVAPVTAIRALPGY